MTCLAPVRRTHSGFTLLELLVVLVLAAITVAVVGGSAQSYMDRARYHQTVRDVASLLVQARMLSEREGRAVVVAYEPESRQLVVDGQWRVALPESLQVQWTAIERRKGAAPVPGEPLFQFNNDGGAQGGSLSLLRAGQGVKYRVNWLLGRVEQASVQAPS